MRSQGCPTKVEGHGLFCCAAEWPVPSLEQAAGSNDLAPFFGCAAIASASRFCRVVDKRSRERYRTPVHERLTNCRSLRAQANCLARGLLDIRSYLRAGIANESQHFRDNAVPFEAQEAREASQEARACEHLPALRGSPSVAAAPIRGRSGKGQSMNGVGRRLAPPLYVAACAIALAGWLWALFAGLTWMIGA